MTLQIGVLMVILLCSLAGRSHAGSAAREPAGPYILIEQATKDDKTALHIIRSSTGKTLWHYYAMCVFGFAWSADHHTLALIIQGKNGDREFILWRLGRRPLIYDHPAFLDDNEGFWSLQLSPDEKRLLFCSAEGQGGWSLTCGDLYVIPVPLTKRYLVQQKSPGGVAPERLGQVNNLPHLGIASAKWVGKHTIRYWAWSHGVELPLRTGVIHLH